MELMKGIRVITDSRGSKENNWDRNSYEMDKDKYELSYIIIHDNY
jgi:hypothetical protein